MKKYMAVFCGSREAMDAWMQLPDRKEKEKEGMMAWNKWMEDHMPLVVDGAPLGKTKRVSKKGIEDVRNDLGAYTIVEAESAEEAAKMFENHPHYMIFPGEYIDVMEVLPIPKVE